MPKGKYIYYWYEYKWPPVQYDYVEALATQVLRHFYYYYCLSIFYAYLWLQFLDLETNPGLQHPVPAVYRILCSNVPGLALSQCNILLCSETLVSDMHHVLELLVPSLGRLSCCARAGWLRPKRWWHTYEMDTEHFANSHLSGVVGKYWFLGFVVWDRPFVCSVFTTTLT